MDRKEMLRRELAIVASEPVFSEEFLRMFPYASERELAALIAQYPGVYKNAIRAARYPALLKGIR